MDLNTFRQLITQRNRYNEEIGKINVYLNQQYELALINGNMDQLNQLREILSGVKNPNQPIQTQNVQSQTAQAKAPQTKSVAVNPKKIEKSKLAQNQAAEKSSDESEDVNEQHLNSWRERVAKMSMNDLKENKKQIEIQVTNYQNLVETSETDVEKTKNLLSAEYYMKCLSIINDRIEVVNKNVMKSFESRASAAMTRKDIAKNKQLISEAPSAEEISARHRNAASDDDSRKGKKPNSKHDGTASESKKGKIKIQVDEGKSDDGSESNIEAPKPVIESESSE